MKPETLYLTEAGLARLMEALRRADTRLVAPVLAEGGHEADYRELGEGDEIALGGPLPRRSLKEFFLPPTEILLRWTQDKGKVALEPPGTKYPTTVVVGAFPCDAAALPIVDKVMDWDYHDDPWFERRKATRSSREPARAKTPPASARQWGSHPTRPRAPISCWCPWERTRRTTWSRF
ncbi:MAG: hypothetical protein ACOCVR_00890 [Myxococcota bacterium]